MWDQRYAEPGFAYGTEPNDFLAASAERYLPAGGEILSLAEGEGRNAVWLARRGFRVTGVDGSAVGLAKARALAAQHGVTIDTLLADLDGCDPGLAPRDGIAVFAGGHLESPVGPMDLPTHPASAAGPDLRQLVLGSEGRLGILTDVTVRTSRLAQATRVNAFVMRDWAQANSDALVRYIRAYVEGSRWVLDPANRIAATGLLADRLKLSPEIAAKSYAVATDPGERLAKDA